MSLSDFTTGKWTIDVPVKAPDCSKAEIRDTFSFHDGGAEVTVDSSGKASHRTCWQATSLHYDPLYDHLKGVMRDGEAVRYVCVTLDRCHDDGAKPARINCYVSARVTVVTPAPDDGGWGGGH